MERYLIINADDFGMCHSGNMATIDLFEKGGITSATVMTPCSWAQEAIRWSAEHPEYAVGIHLTFTSEWKNYRWGPVGYGNSTASLIDDKGYFYPECDGFEDNCDIDEVEAEIRAQVEKAIKLGLNPSHLDNHMASLYGINGNYELMPKTLEVCGDLGYAYRVFSKVRDSEVPKGVPADMYRMLIKQYTAYAKEYNIPTLDHLIIPEMLKEMKSDYEIYREEMYKLLANIGEGVTEIYIHPALESDEIKAITGAWKNRVWEHRFFSDPKTREHILNNGIKLINYRDFIKIREAESANK